jgi:hypothetical protein
MGDNAIGGPTGTKRWENFLNIKALPIFNGRAVLLYGYFYL